MKNILIPIDFKSPSWKLVKCVLSMYPYAGMRFYLIYVTALDLKLDAHVIQREFKETNLKKQLTDLEERLTRNQKIISLPWRGNFIQNIKEAVSDYDIELIVLKTRHPIISNQGKETSLPKDIITRVKCPILMLPKKFKCEQPKQLVLLSDFNFAHRARSTNTLVKFIKDNKSHLHILQLRKLRQALTINQNVNKSFLQNTLGHLPHSFHFVIDKTMDEGLQFYINRNQVDLVILFAKNINILEHILFLKNKERGRDYREEVPFLIIHE
ncbi:universal stress protein [Nonlabens sp.]|uniref:universal stress protein n=1 Tax=Nonlabens sp. TaxID=1888209 RepID=UPI0025CE9304|nr:universal stress protein [Nonlabens sp.]